MLQPNGTFGSRLQGGKDAASARYIYTCLHPLTSLLFKKEDSAILKYLDDDGMLIEPEFYVPIIPTVLVNGAKGIGTGYSTTIPMYNPSDILHNIKSRIQNKEMREMKPWFRGFTGKVEKLEDGNYLTKGTYQMINANTIRITELPIGTWTEKYKEYLESIIVDPKANKKKKKILKSYVDHSTDTKVHLVLKFDYKDVLALRKEGVINGLDGVEKALRLGSKKCTNMKNIHLYNSSGTIQKYTSPFEIINEFYTYRLEMYSKRRLYQLNELEKEMQLISERMRFILELIENTIDLRNKKTSLIESILNEKNYCKLGTLKNYDYLIKMPLQNLTEEKINELRSACEAKRLQVEILQKTTAENMWLHDLNEFTTMYKKCVRKENKQRK